MLKKRPEEHYASGADLALELAKIGRLSGQQRSNPDSERYAALDHMRKSCHSSFMRALVRNLADRLALADIRSSSQAV